ncbi:hypothetical protein VB834_17610 [Limnoraphis robusta Tam1]|uniref:Uncharacterized protein n=1 Tax=Limnoraphis robusta CCNP1315 TaxID=3110306 RepID=A0ABU5U2V7_9CYAN|nr:hypothetical protein [Limnoraphis robusta]MEA5497777.1 hypothetical protein [Limnoraphis robusta BA-68 BA1]MEA5521489.1 hypothetical protein [Limnoraphis robusta CCNP1315]MEA5540839.1 hypothetical protein [Limnoraphis robusta Tam1]MEA5546428.1 hypothetical protein [Limnoraphis robusta CCNP1324]
MRLYITPDLVCIRPHMQDNTRQQDVVKRSQSNSAIISVIP